MAQSGTRESDAAAAGQQPLLRAQLAVTPHPSSSCAVVDSDRDIEEISHHLKVDPAQCEGEQPSPAECSECHTEIRFSESAGGERRYVRSPVDTHCICPVFERHSCIPRIRGVEDGSILFVLTVPGREELMAILEDLESVDASVSVEWLVGEDESHAATAEIDVSTITETQQETLQRAVQAGYYDTPRETSLSELAAEVGVTESAISQRLNAAETKLVKGFLGE